MQRADRIGTPFIHTEQFTQSSLTTALLGVAFLQPLLPSVINATPLGVFDRYDLRWNSGTAKSIAAGQKAGLVAQMTIPKPITGNVCNVEIMAQIWLQTAGLNIVPIFTELTTTPNTILQQATSNGSQTMLNISNNFNVPNTPLATSVGQQFGFKENVLVRDVTAGTPEGLYAFGFALYNPTAGAITFTDFEMQVACRQLMDQPGVEYADTRR